MRRAVFHALILMSLAAPGAATAGDAESRARELLSSATARVATGRPDQRQFARRELEEAHALSPSNDAVTRALGRLYVEGDMLLAARQLALSELRRDPDGVGAQFVLGSAWRREWLAGGDELVRDRAITALARALRRQPGDIETARHLVPMLVDADERRPAFELAQFVARARPDDPESWLLVATAAQLAGEPAIADAWFRRALPRLPQPVREGYQDITPLLWAPQAEAYRALRAPWRREYERRFWRDLDPDPTTPEHEGQLQFWARVTQARLLYGRNQDGEWDTRAQVLIRFGRPEAVERDPVTAFMDLPPGPRLAWSYPSLGFRVLMTATNSMGHYGALYRHALTVPVRASADSLRRHPELLAVEGGFAVFRRLPLDMSPLPIQQTAVRFAVASGTRVLGQAEIEAPPATPFDAVWVVLDSTGTEVARHESPFGASACDPGELRAAAFAADLPPGAYRVAVRVDDGDARRAVSSSDVVVARLPSGLALSDLAVVCGTPAASVVPGSGVRLEPSTGLRPQDGASLNIYFEIYHLTPGPDGTREYEYECTVSPLGGVRRSWLRRAFDPQPGGTPVLASRRETATGEVRRQFFSVPVAVLPAGRYRAEVRVTDVRTGAVAQTATEFTRR